jgi:hypothetical protein
MRIAYLKSGLAAATALALLLASPLYAATAPQNLGFGLDKLVESRAIVKGNATLGIYGGYATEQAASYASMAITDPDSDRVLVDIVPTGKLDFDALKDSLQSAIPSLTVKAVDKNYRSGVGVIEAYVSVDDAEALAKTAGVKAVFLGLKPYIRSKSPVQPPSVVAGDQLNKIGTAFDQGVIQHRVDRINQLYNPSAPVNYDGTGMSIGLMSDSYDTRSTAPHAATAVTNFDLPGASANPWNTQPVVVLQDFPGGTDEGRGMTEIAYKMAPKARLAFATADEGEVGFANNIRALAGLPGYAFSDDIQKGFKADTISDDVGYYDEPWYEDGVINNGVDDVAAAGVSYFSSAANDIGINGYESVLRIVPNGTGLTAATNSALVGTNINLAGVPTSVYAGGFHNFNPNAGQQDVAQLTNVSGTQIVIMQWDDPYDSRDLVLDQPPIYSSGGTIDNTTTTVTFDQTSTPPLPQFTGGQAYVIQETATSGTFDGIVNIYDPSGTLILTQDTGTDETVNFFAPASGQYKIVIGRFSTTTGSFTLTVNTAQGTAGVTTDLNLLVFSASTGAYVASQSLTSNNVISNRPIELGQFAFGGSKQVQFVIARSNTPTQPASQLPTHVRWLIPGNGAGNIGPAEYFKYNSVTTGGHATAAGANGVAAYSVFKPNIPEYYSSPGPATFYFDKDSNRLPVPEVRLQPRVAAADAGNTSFFTSDSGSDLDANPNFAGTSAAGPHAAAIAALVLQSRGGPGSVTPAEMTKILQDSAFPHDLDPAYSSGSAFSSDGANVTVTISSDNELQFQTGGNDTSSFQIFYSGPGSLASITFNASGSAATGGNVTGGNNGPQDDVGSSPATITYFENNFPGIAFLPITASGVTGRAFALGPLTGLTAADITAPQSTSPFTGFSNPTPAPGNGTSQFNTMAIGFPNGNFVSGDAVRFTVGRGVAHSSTTGNGTVIGPGTIAAQYSADLFGGGVLIPSGIVITDGMTFSGTTTGGGTFSGVIRNNIGKGYSVLDGYGFIDASAATGTLSGVGAATPASAYPGDPALFTVTVTPGTNPASTNLAVTASLTAIGGSSSQQFYDDGSHGDAVAGDNVFSFATTVALNAQPGTYAIPASISDGQARTGNTQINFTVSAATPPSGIGAATPAAVSQTESSLLTVAVTPGNGPVSTGIAVTVDLSSIGGSPTQAMYDDGTNGDATANDGTFSFNAPVLLGVTPGAKSLPVTITDAQSRSGSTTIGLTVLAETAPTGVASATPNAAAAGDTSLFTVVVTGGTNPASSGITVTADLSRIGGSATQALYDDGTHGDVTAGDGTYSYSATVDAAATPGPKVLPFTIADAQGRSSSTSIGFNVLGAGGPTGAGLATPATVNLGQPVVLLVSVTPGSNPISTGLAVTVDLTSIGGSATQAFYDDGTNGDQVAGDNIFTFATTVSNAAVVGTDSLPVTITDGESRTGSATIQITVIDEIFANGFE